MGKVQVSSPQSLIRVSPQDESFSIRDEKHRHFLEMALKVH